jgi:hypothetical protein
LFKNNLKYVSKMFQILFIFASVNLKHILNNMRVPRKKEWPRTIAEDLHVAWLKVRRPKDGEVIAIALGFSRPVIDRALNFGYVANPDLTEKISEFFTNRLNKERESAQNLVNNQNQFTA